MALADEMENQVGAGFVQREIADLVPDKDAWRQVTPKLRPEPG